MTNVNITSHQDTCVTDCYKHYKYLWQHAPQSRRIFITHLPKSQGHTQIVVVVDRCTKMAQSKRLSNSESCHGVVIFYFNSRVYFAQSLDQYL